MTRSAEGDEDKVGPDQLGESAAKKPRTAGAAGSKRSLDEPQNSQEKEKEKGTAPPAKKLRVDRRGMKTLTSFFEVKPK